ncbi:hypothetical protein DICPUDRAFT_77451 [Dictyostelium purpureum]|uniref:FNIP repeat-containing protein n=1 Tax=Dictyostelium purpureum TaxID=5786 RepID=F0ZGM9_DICPU|nr:uncharacterized protein DICPUDRAFT_77451 [Dictyostelium purpureum]EGC36934.1 hypothetical protein DICPUDRAFT_77451 [Dictyostelium purpureum]|eukprot:XP_003286577.1 hypothetical protein DICPUDRAFT_77451 [Dictyostelium purpureum]
MDNIVNSYDINNNRLFYLLIKNKTIFKIILKFLKLLNFKNLLKKYYDQYSNFYWCNDKYFTSSIIIKTDYKDIAELPRFLECLPENVSSLSFDSGIVEINVKELNIPETLKHLDLDKICIVTDGFSDVQEEVQEIEKYAKVFNSLKKFKIPGNIKIKALPSFQSLTSLDVGNTFSKKLEASYLPPNLESLRLGKAYLHKIEKGVLPGSLKSLIIASNYDHPAMELPENLKILHFEKGSKNISVSILKCVPNSVTNLYLCGDFKEPVESFSNILPESLKRLKALILVNKNCFKSKSKILSLFNPPIVNYVQGFPIGLVYLDLFSANSIIGFQNLNPNYFPQTLKTLKIGDFFMDQFKKGCGLPASLTSIEGPLKIVAYPFNNPGNIETLKLHFHLLFVEGSFLSNKFPNVKSMKTYCYMDSQFKFNPPETINNLEMISYSTNISNNNIINFAPNNNIKSLKLESIQTYSIIKEISLDKSICPFPSTCLLLDLDFNNSIYTSENPTTISTENLPESLKVLVLRGTFTPKPLPPFNNNLECIFISDQNKSILNDTVLMNEISKFIITYNDIEDRKTNKYSNSVLYRKLKKYINNVK